MLTLQRVLNRTKDDFAAVVDELSFVPINDKVPVCGDGFFQAIFSRRNTSPAVLIMI